MSGQHARKRARRVSLPVAAAAGAGLVVAGLALPFSAGSVGAAVPRGADTAVSADPGPVAAVDSPPAAATNPADVQIADPIVVTRDNPTPHNPLDDVPGSYVIRPARTPCQRESDHLAVLATNRRPATQLVDADDAAVIARALIAECGWTTDRVQEALR